MSDFGEGIIERLNINSSLNNPNNPMRKIINDGVGEWLENFSQDFLAENVFLDSATGKWLDVHGSQFNVPRKLEEQDDKYRERIVYESIGHLTTNYLKEVYEVELYSYVQAFNVTENQLVSSNPHLCNDGFIGIADNDTREILNKKFLLDNNFYWIYEDGEIDYIIDLDNNNLLPDYNTIYTFSDLDWYWEGNSLIKKVHLTLPNTINGFKMMRNCSNLVNLNLNCPKLENAQQMLQHCTNLSNINLECPNLITGAYLFDDCPNLVNVELTLNKLSDATAMFGSCRGLKKLTLKCPNLSSYQYMFDASSNLEYLNFIIPESIKDDFKNYILSRYYMPHLQTLIINGEEVEL